MTYVDTMAVFMTKEREDISFVWYKFEFNFETETYLSKSKQIRHIFEPKYGIIKLSKNIFDIDNLQNKVFEIEKDETDPIYFMLDTNQLNLIRSLCFGAIMICKTGSDFPERASKQIG